MSRKRLMALRTVTAAVVLKCINLSELSNKKIMLEHISHLIKFNYTYFRSVTKFKDKHFSVYLSNSCRCQMK